MGQVLWNKVDLICSEMIFRKSQKIKSISNSLLECQPNNFKDLVSWL